MRFNPRGAVEPLLLLLLFLLRYIRGGFENKRPAADFPKRWLYLSGFANI